MQYHRQQFNASVMTLARPAWQVILLSSVYVGMILLPTYLVFIYDLKKGICELGQSMYLTNPTLIFYHLALKPMFVVNTLVQ